MRRSSPRPESNSTHTARQRKHFDADRSIRELQERVARLERFIAENFGLGTEGLPEVLAAAERQKPGPKPYNSGMILSDRDRLVELLEDFWPEIEPQCLPKPQPKALGAVLRAVESREEKLRPGERRYLWATKHLLNSLPQVCEFLSGNRFRRDPRQIANAFAGFPQISTWRSLKLCQAKPCNRHMGQRTIKAYLRRKHPELFGNLLAKESMINFANSLRSYRTRDRRLAGFTAKYLLYCWAKCVPDKQLLGEASAVQGLTRR
jgi:hypothetical protein